MYGEVEAQAALDLVDRRSMNKKIVLIPVSIATVVLIALSVVLLLNFNKTNVENTDIESIVTIAKEKNQKEGGDVAKEFLLNIQGQYDEKGDDESVSRIEYEIFLIDHPNPIPYSEEDATVK